MTHLIHAIGHVKINTNAYKAVVKEATGILGLRVTKEEGNEIWLSSNGREAELVLVKSSDNNTHTLGFEALTKDAVLEAESRVEAAGCKILSRTPSMNCIEASVTFATPEGLRFEIHTPIRDKVYGRRFETSGVGLNRMDHLNLLSPNPVATRTQLEQIGGMKLSERMVDDSLSWMYGGNRQHHICGVVKGESAGLHHYSFEAKEFGDYLRLGDKLDDFEKQMLWGPGRHRPGDNTYAYYIDPAGCIVEVSGAMALIADDVGFEAPVVMELTRPANVRRMNVWGTPAPIEWREHRFPFQKV